MNKLTAILMSVAMAGLLSTAGTAGADVIAFWEFESGALTTDSSGNGNTLATTGDPTSVADKAAAAGGTNSVALDGSDALSVSLDLSSYDYIRVSWYMKTGSTSVSTIYEHSSDYGANNGGITSWVNDGGAGTGMAGVRTSTGFNVDNYSHATDSTWEYFEVEYDIRTGTGTADIVDVITPGGTASAGHQASNTVPFLNDTFYIGARGASNYFLTGNIDQFKIESVPEPATMALLGMGGIGLLIRRRRK
ncbi:MAG: PEP-CTERM sorting domain-containing protein [Phycisphaerae bacterium]|nr:PEP-CTERM sorting domain-containing protein [Phycisphaerae bacterium]